MLTEVSGVLPGIVSSYPLDADTWQVVADATIGSYDLQVIALCAELPGQNAGQEFHGGFGPR